MQELLDIVSKIGGQYAMVSAAKLIRYPSVQTPEPPVESLDDVFSQAQEFMNGEQQ